MNQFVALPKGEVIGEILSGILGRQVKVEKSIPMDLKSRAPRVYAVYRDSEEPHTNMCVCDFALGVHAAGALLAFPACTINDALKTSTLDEGLFDAIREILNICAQMFNDRGHQVLQMIDTDVNELPEEARSILKAPLGRLDLTITITGVGSGKLTVLIG